MSNKAAPNNRTQKGRKLASHLYDLDMTELLALDQEQKAALRQQYPPLTTNEVEDVIQQVVDARLYEQARVGWFTLPHDLTVLVLVLVTWLFGLRPGLIAGVAVLVLLESIIQFTFHFGVYKVFSYAVWLTYPAYLLFGYVLYAQEGFAWYWAVLGAVLAWGGTFVLGVIFRLPARMILGSLARGREAYEERKGRKN
ncbi:MAG: hypothetical protein JXA25_04260 [Anaerolineales bacterium]|nr:hypothetical protein [Anaerolineales bacterium]